MSESINYSASDVLGSVEKAFDEDGTANYGCFYEIFGMIQSRATLIAMMSDQIPNSQAILNEMYQMMNSLPDLHDESLSQACAERLQQLMPI